MRIYGPLHCTRCNLPLTLVCIRLISPSWPGTHTYTGSHRSHSRKPNYTSSTANNTHHRVYSLLRSGGGKPIFPKDPPQPTTDVPFHSSSWRSGFQMN